MDPVVRRFADEEGLHWTARRFVSALGRGIGPSFGPAPRSDTLPGGWLTFECEETGWLRRLAPAPDDWATCSEDELREYHAAARHVRQRPKSGPLP